MALWGSSPGRGGNPPLCELVLPGPRPPGVPGPSLHSQMQSWSQRAVHFSSISFALDTTCCSFSLICREEERAAQALGTLPPCEATFREVLQRMLGLVT